MLSERDRQLLTAYVDGELSARQRRLVDRLLERSEPGRILLQKLQDDAARLKRLPRPDRTVDLSGSILQTIADRRLTPGRRRPVKARLAVPAWTGVAAAAAVLLILGAASYLYFASSEPSHQGGSLAQRSAHNGNRDKTPPEKHKDDFNPDITPNVAKRPDKNQDDKPAPADGGQDPWEQDPYAQVPNPSPPPPDSEPDLNMSKDPPGPVFTDRGMEMFELKIVETKPLRIVPLLDLENDGPYQKLLTELEKSSSFRMELPCVDGTRAFQRLEAVSKSTGVNLIQDSLVNARLKKPFWRTNYLLVLENQSPHELLQLLRQLGIADRQAAARKSGDAQFDRLVVSPLADIDRRELADLLGIEPGQVQLPRPSGPPTLDPNRPLAQQTAEQLARALAGQGGNPRPDGSKPAAKSSEQPPVLALTMPPVRPSRNSPEIKRFLDSRKPARPGTIQVMLVLRTVGS